MSFTVHFINSDWVGPILQTVHADLWTEYADGGQTVDGVCGRWTDCGRSADRVRYANGTDENGRPSNARIAFANSVPWTTSGTLSLSLLTITGCAGFMFMFVWYFLEAFVIFFAKRISHQRVGYAPFGTLRSAYYSLRSAGYMYTQSGRPHFRQIRAQVSTH